MTVRDWIVEVLGDDMEVIEGQRRCLEVWVSARGY